MKVLSGALFSFAIVIGLLACGSGLRGQAETCVATASLACDDTLRDYAAQDEDGARDAYRRMTSTMQRGCDDLMTGHASRASDSSGGVLPAPFMCLRLAALQLGAVGIDAGRIASRQSALAPNQVPLNWSDGIAKLTFLCGADAQWSGASEEACLMLGDVAHAQRDLVQANARYEVSCRHGYPSNEGLFAACVANAPRRSEARWLSDGVRAHLPPGTPSELPAVAAVASTAPATASTAPTAPVAPARPVATSSPSTFSESESQEEATEPLPVCLAPPSHPCLGTWTLTERIPSGEQRTAELVLFRNEGMPTVCGGFKNTFTRSRGTHWGLVRCAWQEHGLTAVAQSRELETLYFEIECRGNQATLDSRSDPENGEIRTWTRRLRRQP